MVKNTGSASEEAFELHFRKKYGKRAFVHRITDSKEVRGLNKNTKVFTKEQPSDYIVTEDGVMYYAEVKSSNNLTSFPFSQISKGQIRAAKQQQLARGSYFFFLHNIPEDTWYRVPAELILSAEKKSLKWEELINFKWNILK